MLLCSPPPRSMYQSLQRPNYTSLRASQFARSVFIAADEMAWQLYLIHWHPSSHHESKSLLQNLYVWRMQEPKSLLPICTLCLALGGTSIDGFPNPHSIKSKWCICWSLYINLVSSHDMRAMLCHASLFMCDFVGDPPTVASNTPGRTFVELLP